MKIYAHAMQMRKTILLLLAVLATSCSSMQAIPQLKPKALKEWLEMANSLQPTILRGEWQSAEIAWRDLKIAMPVSEKAALEFWIDLQVKIVDETSMDPQKLLLRKMALQELEFYPEISIKYYNWALTKSNSNSFADPDMQAHLDLILSRFEKIRSTK